MQSGGSAFWDTILSYSILRQRILTSSALTSSRLDDFSDIVAFMGPVMITIFGGSWAVFFFVLGGGGVGGWGASNSQIPKIEP